MFIIKCGSSFVKRYNKKESSDILSSTKQENKRTFRAFPRNTILVIFLSAAVMVCILLMISQSKEIERIETKALDAKYVYTQHMNYGSLFYLFDEVIQQPTKANLTALHSALSNKEGQIKIFLELSREEIPQNLSTSRFLEPASPDYLLSITLKDGLSEFDYENLIALKSAWETFANTTGEGLSFKINDVVAIAQGYVTLIETVDIITE